jgi:hypothetical protein
VCALPHIDHLAAQHQVRVRRRGLTVAHLGGGGGHPVQREEDSKDNSTG